MRLILRLAAPALAVGVFWFGFESAWMTILAYHAQILFWSRHRIRAVLHGRGGVAAVAVAVIPCAVAGPLLYFLLPRITLVDSTTWLAAHGLAGGSLVLMIPYFGIVHPVLEQTHWDELRNRTPLAHGCFAGYHLLVLASLLSLPWLGLVLAVLLGASYVWYRLARRYAGLFVPSCMHVAADLGIVLAAWLRTRA
jgi:hypothetical protein